MDSMDQLLGVVGMWNERAQLRWMYKIYLVKPYKLYSAGEHKKTILLLLKTIDIETIDD